MKIIAQTIFLAGLLAPAAGEALRADKTERKLQDFDPDDLGEALCIACEACVNDLTSEICRTLITDNTDEDVDALIAENCGDCEYLVTDPETGDLLCFSEEASVQVLQPDQTEQTVTMKDLQVGDQVATGMNQYDTVYAFAHHLPNKPAEFYQIHSENADRPLEVTGEHLVFLNKGPVAAANVQVGDVLEGESKITKISTVKRDGIYAPLTTGGSLIVDGVKASSYVRIGDKEGLLSDHDLIHTTLAPFRMFCSGVSGRFCENDFNTENGMPFYVQYGLNVLRFVSESGVLVQAAAWPVILGVTGTFRVVEILFGARMAPLMILLGAVAYAQQKKNKKVKSV